MSKRGDNNRGDKPSTQFKISSNKRKRSLPPASATMSRDFSSAKVCVLWDMVDCPAPVGYDPASISQKIESALGSKGYCVEDLQISVFGGERETLPEDTLRQYWYAGFYLEPEVSRGTSARVFGMLRDILLFIYDNPEPSVLMVISKNMSDEITFLRALQYLKSRHHKFLFVQPHKPSLGLLLRFVDSLWLWETLLHGGHPIHQLDDSF